MEPSEPHQSFFVRLIEPFKLLTPVLWLFLGTMILANIAGQMDLPLRPLYVQELGANVRQIGLFFTLGAIAPLIFQILGGWLSDSIGRLQAIAIGSLGGVLGYIVYIVAPGWQWLLIASVFSAMAFAFVGPSFQAFIAEQSTDENRGRVYGLIQTMYMIVGVIGPPIGGLIAQNLNFKTMFIVAGLLYTTAAVIRIFMARSASKDTQQAQKREKPSFANLKKSLTLITGMVLGGSIVTWIFVTDGVGDFVYKLRGDLTPVYLENIIDLSLVEISSLTSIFSVTMMIFSGLGGWLSDKRGERLTLAVGFAISGLSTLLFLVGRSYVPFAASWLVAGIGQALIGPAYNSLISKAVPENLRGTAFGLFATSLGFISLPAPWIGAQLWERYSPLTPFWLGLLATLISIPIIWFKFYLPDNPSPDETTTPEYA